MKKIILRTSLLLFLFVSFFNKINAAVNDYNFSQKQDTIQALTGGNVFLDNRGNGTVYYGLPNVTFGYYNPSNYVFAGIPIGFNFIFNGQAQDVFGINSKGYLIVGSGTINMLVSPSTNPISGNSQANIISALGGNLVATYGTVIRYDVLGSAPNRILAVQWENMARRYASNIDSLTFQVRLHESTNKIEFVYTNLFIPKQGIDQFYEVGLKGATPNDFCNRKQEGTWANTISGYGKNTNCLLGKYNYPAKGTCFIYTPPNQPCSNFPMKGYATASNYSTGAGNTIGLSLDSLTLGLNASLEWQKSVDSLNWNFIPGGTFRNINIVQNSKTFYRCKILCGANSGYSNSIKITQLDSLQVYCSGSYSRYPDAINIGNVQISNLNNGSALPALSQQLFHAYSDFTYLPAATMMQGGNYEIQVSEIFKSSYLKSGIMVFIDYNHNGIFSGADEEIFIGKTKSNPDGYYQKSFIQIPDNAPLGKTKMRVVLYDPNTQLPVESCDASFNGETEDYLINVTQLMPCSSVPDTVYTASSMPSVCSNVQFKLFLSSALASGNTYQWYKSADSLSWTAISGANKNACLTTQAQLSFYKCLVKCQALDSVYSIPIRVDVAPFYDCYCDAKAINPSDFQIGNVQLSNLNNSSGSKVKLYSNYTALASTNLVRGGNYSFSVTQKNIVNNSGGATIKAFIDFDGNGVYGNNLNEVITFGSTTSSVFPDNTISLVLIVPDSAHLGLTGMRIALWDIYGPGYSNGCGNFNHGEIEDYLLDIAAPGTCLFPLSAGNTKAQDSSICAGQNVHLTLSGIVYSPLYQYQWQTSSDSVNWTNVANANLFTLTIIQNVKTFYRCKVSCSGSDVYSIPTSVPLNSFLNCYCASYPYNTEVTDIGNIQLAGYSYGKDTLSINASGDNAYTDFTDSLPVIVLEKGGLYPMRIIAARTQFSIGNSKAYVYIDFNGNGTFEASENFNTGLFTTSSRGKGTVTITVPNGIYTGYTRMRVILLDGYNPPVIQAACGSYTNFSGETEDYLINIVNPLPCQSLFAGIISASSYKVCPATSVTFNYSGNTYQAFLKYQWQVSSDSLNWTGLDSTQLPTLTRTIYVSNYYRCVAKCQTESDTSGVVKVKVRPQNQCYCTSGFSSADYVDIGNIKIAGYNYGKDTLQSNPFVNNSYSDFTDSLPAIVLQRGGDYPLKIQAAKIPPYYYYNTIASIYIDYNQNGIFDVAEKTVSNFFTTSFPCIGLAELIIPGTALSGITHMRIVLNAPFYYQTGPPACGVNAYFGETEDYLVNIISPLPCQPLQSNGISASASPNCYGTSFTLISPSNAYQPQLNYVWQSSFDNVNWTSFDTTRLPSISVIMDTTKYYRSIAVCQAEADTSGYRLVSLTPFNQCYCSSSPYFPGNLDIGNIKIAGFNYGGDTLPNATPSNTYSNFTTSLPPIIMERGGLYPTKISEAKTQGFSYLTCANVYIDYNHSGTFDQNEVFFIGNFTNTFPYFGTTLVTVPTNSKLGLTRMRIVLIASGFYSLSNPPACGSYYYYGETEDYMVDIITPLPCQTLQHGTIASTKNPVCSNTQVTLNYSGNAYQASMRYIWQSSIDTLNWITRDTINLPTYQFTIATDQYYRCIAYCSSQSDTSQILKINFQPFYNCYCSSSVALAGNVDVGNIKIAGYSYGSDTLQLNPNTNNTYSDFTDSLPTINLEQGGHYPMDVVAAKEVVFNYLPNASVYIDFNHNRVFDSNEFFFINNYPSIFPFLGTTVVNVPSTALLGITRMRVIVNACGPYLNGPPACGVNSYYGETEDYLVNIIATLPCPAMLHGTLSVPSKQICPVEKFKIKYVGNPYQSAFSYKWQYSVDSINWILVNGTFYNEYSNNLFSPTYFRCIANCGAGIDTTAALRLTPKPYINCYCNSFASDTNFVDIGNLQIAGFSYGTDTLPVNPDATHSYSDFTSSLPPIALEKGGHYPTTIMYALSSSVKVDVTVNIYIDFNQDGYFESTELLTVPYFSSTYPYTGRLQINIPVTAALGLARMRIVLTSGLNMSAAIDACSPYQYGETEDYMLSIINPLPCQPMVKGKVKSAKAKNCPAQSLTLIYSGNAYHAQSSYTWQSSPNGSVWYNCAYTNIPTYTGTFYPNQANQYRCIAICGIYKDTSTALLIPVNDFYRCYCQSNFVTSINQDIGNVTLNTLNNGIPFPFLNNASSASSYSDFTSMAPTDLTQGFIYTMTVSQINSADFHRSKVKAYIDFNADGNFSGPGEEFLIGVTSDTSAQPGKLTANIIVPFNADTGITGLRIVMNEKYDNNAVAPCNYYINQWGETEDYLVKIISNANCTAPVAGNAVAPISSYCSGDSAYLRLENNVPLNGQSYQWQSSIDSLNWNNVGTKTAFSNKLLRLFAAQYFRCEVSCGTYIAYSLPAFIDMLPSSVCNYTSCSYLGGSECFWEDKITHVVIQGTSLDNADTTCYKANGSFYYTFPDKQNTTATLGRGKFYKLFVTSSTNNNISVWVDYNHNNIFSIDEWKNVTDSSVAGVPDSVLLDIPSTAQLGKTRMRIRSRYAKNQNDVSDACTFFFSGETEDYILNIDLASNILNSSQATDISIEPNPAHENIAVSFTNAFAEDVKLKLVNAQGREVYAESLMQIKGKFHKTIHVSELAKGIYILQLRSNTKVINRKIVIE